MNPAESIVYLGWALGIGAVLGLCYGFLRPVRPRWLGDAVFVGCAFYGFLYLGFAVCRGDIRFGYTVGLFLAAVALDQTLGKVLRKPFYEFWRIISENFWKKPRKSIKNLLAKRKKDSKI